MPRYPPPLVRPLVDEYTTTPQQGSSRSQAHPTHIQPSEESTNRRQPYNLTPSSLPARRDASLLFCFFFWYQRLAKMPQYYQGGPFNSRTGEGGGADGNNFVGRKEKKEIRSACMHVCACMCECVSAFGVHVKDLWPCSWNLIAGNGCLVWLFFFRVKRMPLDKIRLNGLWLSLFLATHAPRLESRLLRFTPRGEWHGDEIPRMRNIHCNKKNIIQN